MIFLMLYLPEGEAIITFVLYFAVKKKNSCLQMPFSNLCLIYYSLEFSIIIIIIFIKIVIISLDYWEE